MTKNERLKAAKHEAGHALLHILKNLPFDRVWVGQENYVWFGINRAPDALGGVEESHSLDNADLFNEQQRQDAGVTTMAGLAGERVGRRSGSAWCRGHAVQSASADIQQMFTSELLDGEVDKDIVNRWLKTAHDILTEHSDAHRRLTDALVERGTLEYGECKALFEQDYATAGKE